MEAYLAHISEDGERVQTLKAHLEGTAVLAAEFASAFGAEDAAKIAGLYHDIGKYSDAFQKRIRGAPYSVDHSTAGAQVMGRLGQIELAFCIAGHHGGLPDLGDRGDTADDATLMGRMRRRVEDYSAWKQELELPQPPPPVVWGKKYPNFALSFYTRMLYSCLVDADYIDTEAFMNNTEPRQGEYDPLPGLLERVRAKADGWLSAPNVKGIGQIRNEILRSCIRSGLKETPGLFTLTVPTGGGKTFASLAFALEHAVRNGLDRVIYVVPYTSIIDQTVKEYRKVLGEDNVLAHYGEADYRCKNEADMTPGDHRQMTAAENWDAPVIVTTAVQFFESLFADRSSQCRKLHNIAGAVLIFDEAQTLPVPYLRPCIAALGQLVQRYRSSAVLCTATQSALEPMLAEFAPGWPVREICQTGSDLFAALKRTTLKILGRITKTRLTEFLNENKQVLCVVNRRATAQELFASLPEDGRFCLTTLLTPADRRMQLDEIRRRLKNGLPCRVVSTSLIEAGVDVDFPVVMREETGLDSIIQTAGRCNREGRRPVEESLVYVFSLEDLEPPRALRLNRDVFRSVLAKFPEAVESPAAIHSYFRDLWYLKGDQVLDSKGILDAFEHTLNGKKLPFRQVAEQFRLIETPTRTVYIPVGEGAELCKDLRQGRVSRSLYRQLGRWAVNVYPDHFEELRAAGALELLNGESAILLDLNRYNKETGLQIHAENDPIFV